MKNVKGKIKIKNSANELSRLSRSGAAIKNEIHQTYNQQEQQEPPNRQPKKIQQQMRAEPWFALSAKTGKAKTNRTGFYFFENVSRDRWHKKILFFLKTGCAEGVKNRKEKN